MENEEIEKLAAKIVSSAISKVTQRQSLPNYEVIKELDGECIAVLASSILDKVEGSMDTILKTLKKNGENIGIVFATGIMVIQEVLMETNNHNKALETAIVDESNKRMKESVSVGQMKNRN